MVWHRNHLSVISANPLSLTAGTYYYDFSTGPEKAFGGTSALKLLGGGVWGMMGGDGNISILDKDMVWDVQTGTTGYYEGDFNMDNQDKNDILIGNVGKGSQVPE